MLSKPLPWWLRSLLVTLAYLTAGRLGLALPGPSPLISPFWPAAGLALAALWRWGPAQVPAIALGALLVNLSAGASPWLAGAIAVGNTGGPWLAVRWMQRAGFNPRLEQRRDLLLLIGAGALGATVISAANGAAWLAVAGRISPLDLPLTALYWWLGDTLGVFVAGVPLLTLRPGQRWRTVSLLAGTAMAAALAFAAPPTLGLGALGLMLLPHLLLCWMAMRSGLGPASAAGLLLTTATLAATAAGIGPFAVLPVEGGLMLLWIHAATLSALVLLSHVQVGELSRLEDRWRLALVGSDLGVADWNLRTRMGYCSPRWRAMMDDPDDGLGNSLERWLSQVHVDDREALSNALAAVDTPAGTGLRRELRLRVRDGWHWFDLHLIVAERDPTGVPVRVVASLADIGARRSAEDRQQLSTSVFMHLHEGLVVTDAELRLLDANPTYCRIVGIPRDELIGTVPGPLRPGATDIAGRPQQASLWAGLRSAGTWVGERVAFRVGLFAATLRFAAGLIDARHRRPCWGCWPVGFDGAVTRGCVTGRVGTDRNRFGGAVPSVCRDTDRVARLLRVAFRGEG